MLELLEEVSARREHCTVLEENKQREDEDILHYCPK
jgi:hypothetical protein